MKYIRCNVVGFDCKFMIKSEDEQEVIDKYGAHLKEVHGDDPKAMVNTIKASVRTHQGSSAAPAPAQPQPRRRGTGR